MPDPSRRSVFRLPFPRRFTPRVILAALAVPALAATAGSRAAPPTPRARFVPLATFAQCSLTHGEAWSPSGRYIAVDDGAGLSIVDPARPDVPPWRVPWASVNPGHCWSPDGTWIAFRSQPPAPSRRGAADLLAIRVGADRPDTLLEDADIHRIVWAADGTLDVWGRRPGSRRRLASPAEWKASRPAPSAPHAHLVTLWDPATSRHLPYLFRPGAGEAALMTPLADRGIEWVLPRGRFPDGERFLVTALLPPCGRTLAVDGSGRALTDFGPACGDDGFEGTSVSFDGRFIAGHRETDDGHEIRASILYLAEAGGAWRTPIEDAPHGLSPRFSPRELVIAYDDWKEGAIHVGRLEIVDR